MKLPPTQSTTTSRSKLPADYAKDFWDVYEKEGARAANRHFMANTYGVPAVQSMAVRYLLEEARARKIDIIKFITDLDAAVKEEVENATAGIIDGPSGIRSVSSDQVDKSEDADESAPSRNADGEDRSPEQGV